MTTLLVSTFVFGGIHTLLWLPKALQMRRELRAEEAREAAEKAGLHAPNSNREDNHAG